VGFIVGATTLTGLGLKFAAAVLGLAHGVAYGLMSVQNLIHFQMLTTSDYTLFFTLVFTAIACFILGMGIPTTAQYIIAVMIAAPALMQWHVHPLLSHMFVFFYAVLADVTPPVALAAFAAAGISGADPFKTGFTAFNLSMAKVFFPFAFIYSPLVLLMPRLLDPTASFDITATSYAAGPVAGKVSFQVRDYLTKQVVGERTTPFRLDPGGTLAVPTDVKVAEPGTYRAAVVIAD
jgi:TRAP-type uncharacterized transport system fused permease subunit